MRSERNATCARGSAKTIRPVFAWKTFTLKVARPEPAPRIEPEPTMWRPLLVVRPIRSSSR